MIIRINKMSEDPIYIQIREQIIAAIAQGVLRPGDSLPSVRSLANDLGVNLHTVNKAYSVLRQEGFVKLDRRKGAVVSLEADKERVMDEMREEIAVALAKGICKGVQREEVHRLVDEMYDVIAGLEGSET